MRSLRSPNSYPFFWLALKKFLTKKRLIRSICSSCSSIIWWIRLGRKCYSDGEKLASFLFGLSITGILYLTSQPTCMISSGYHRCFLSAQKTTSMRFMNRQTSNVISVQFLLYLPLERFNVSNWVWQTKLVYKCKFITLAMNTYYYHVHHFSIYHVTNYCIWVNLGLFHDFTKSSQLI